MIWNQRVAVLELDIIIKINIASILSESKCKLAISNASYRGFYERVRNNKGR